MQQINFIHDDHAKYVCSMLNPSNLESGQIHEMNNTDKLKSENFQFQQRQKYIQTTRNGSYS